jgi:hypothetical protein
MAARRIGHMAILPWITGRAMKKIQLAICIVTLKLIA